jgi:8-oxo-dGDP phosphatase
MRGPSLTHREAASKLCGAAVCQVRSADVLASSHRQWVEGTLISVERLGSKQVYANPWMTVREDAIRRADGSTGIYGVVDTADIALVIPAEGERLHLVEQYRYPVAGRRWEFPSGTADQGLDEDPAALAARELREETGLVAGRLEQLGALDVAPSMFGQRCSVFLATDLKQGAPERELEEQDMRSEWFARAEVERMISDGTITDAKTIAAYALLLLHDRPRPEGA